MANLSRLAVLPGPRLLSTATSRHPADRDANLRGFLDVYFCCLDPWFGRPLRASIQTIAAVLSPTFLAELARLGRQMRGTNMTLEGEFAAIKAAAPASRKSLGAERLSYVG